MKEHESPEAAQARASQEDPIVMYLIVHESLGMGVGKTAAQCAHASQMLTLEYFEKQKEPKLIQIQINKIRETPSEELEKLRARYAELSRPLSIFGEWMASSFRKVVLSADDKNWQKIKSEFKGHNMVLVIDAGLTEIAPGSETCIGLWPMRKSQASKLIKRLQTLK